MGEIRQRLFVAVHAPISAALPRPCDGRPAWPVNPRSESARPKLQSCPHQQRSRAGPISAPLSCQAEFTDLIIYFFAALASETLIKKLNV